MRLPHLIVTGLLLAGVAGFYSEETGFTSLLGFGEVFAGRAVPELQRVPHVVQPGDGYDGQFYSQLALDPLLGREATVAAMDFPGYRARRVPFPLAAYGLGIGRPGLVLNIYALLNVGCWLALAALMLRWLPPGELRPVLAWCACLLSHGTLMSLRLAVPDGPSVLLLALAVWAVERQRSGLGAGILGIAALGRETNLLGGAILAPTGRSALGPSSVALAHSPALVTPLRVDRLFDLS